MRSFVILILSFFAVLPVNAELAVSTPDQVCSLLGKAGLATRGWKNYYDNKYGCSSPYKELGSGFPLANNLAFYAEGTTSAAKQVKLVLNINNRASASSAHQELVKAATALSVKATGEQLPQPMQDAIKNGKNASQKVGAAMVEVLREKTGLQVRGMKSRSSLNNVANMALQPTAQPLRGFASAELGR